MNPITRRPEETNITQQPLGMSGRVNVLSLFNGCGMLRPALDKAGIEIESFYSSEIDKYANQIARKNYPDTVQMGDINNWDIWDFLPEIDLLTAGFPCQDLSVAGKQLGLNGERSGLLYEALKIRDALKPKYFLFENVASMSKHWRNEITRLVGVNPVELNSKYWGAQNRARLFWTNIPGAKNIEMMQVQNDRKIYLKDILIDGFVDCEKSRCLTARYEGVAESENQIVRYFDGKPGQLVFTGISQAEYDSLFISSEKQLQILKSDVPSDEMQRVAQLGDGSQSFRIYGRNGKSQTLAALGGGGGSKTGLVFACPAPQGFGFVQPFKQDGKVFTLTAQDKHGVYSQEIGIRKLHPIECEHLMNLPDGYTEGVSNSQRRKMLGNGWDVFVVADLLRGLVELVIDIQPDLFAGVVNG